LEKLRRALRHALWSPAFCTGTHFLSASSEENAPPAAARWARECAHCALVGRFGAIWEEERTGWELGCV